MKTRKKPQLIYTLAILEKYQQTKENISSANDAKKRIVYNNTYKMMQESLLLGSTRFGINYIF